MNHYEKHLAHKKDHLAKIRLIDIKRNRDLLELSLDYSGTNLSKFFNKKDIKLCKDFMSLMAKHNFLGSTKLTLKVKFPLKLLDINEINYGPINYGIISKIFNKNKWLKTWEGVGFPIGILTSHSSIYLYDYNSSILYLCNDFKLRCQRHEPVFTQGQTYAFGVGSLPNIKHFKLNFNVGILRESNDDTRNLSYQKEDINSILIKHIENNLID